AGATYDLYYLATTGACTGGNLLVSGQTTSPYMTNTIPVGTWRIRIVAFLNGPECPPVEICSNPFTVSTCTTPSPAPVNVSGDVCAPSVPTVTWTTTAGATYTLEYSTSPFSTWNNIPIGGT